MSPTRRRRARALRVGNQILTAVPLLLVSFVILFPLYVMLMEPFKTQGQMFADPLGWPSQFSLDNFVQAWSEANFGAYFQNSLIVTVGAVALSLVASSMAAFVLARYTMRGLSGMHLFFVLGLILPVRLLVMALIAIMKPLDLLNSLVGLILVYAAASLPFAIFILANYMRQIPRELDDAARVDGASEFAIYRSVILPLSRPGLAVIAIYNIVYVWNDWFLPLIFLSSPNLRTIPLGVTIFYSEYSTQWTLIFASLVMSSVPVLFCFMVVSRQFIRGVTQGALK